MFFATVNIHFLVFYYVIYLKWFRFVEKNHWMMIVQSRFEILDKNVFIFKILWVNPSGRSLNRSNKIIPLSNTTRRNADVKNCHQFQNEFNSWETFTCLVLNIYTKAYQNLVWDIATRTNVSFLHFPPISTFRTIFDNSSTSKTTVQWSI